MEELIASFVPVIRKYAVESILLFCALAVAAISLALYFRQGNAVDIETAHAPIQTDVSSGKQVATVFVAGAVRNQGVYELPVGSRLQDAVRVAGGLSEDADTAYFNRNFNLARYIADQEKIYIPNVQEISNNIFTERKQIIEYLEPQIISALPEIRVSQTGISINVAEQAELESLPGIGKVTAAKIIQLRPYGSLGDLLKKKAVTENVYDQIKELISL